MVAARARRDSNGFVLAIAALIASLATSAPARVGLLPAPALPAADPPGATSTIAGHVLAPDGSPQPGAVVTSSAGGQAVTGADGAFQLEVVLPGEAGSVMVTAVAQGPSGSLLAQVLLETPAPAGPLAAGVLSLSTADCLPGWKPTFGFDDVLSTDVNCLLVHDLGGAVGRRLVVGGAFQAASAQLAHRVAFWDGMRWQRLGTGFNNEVYTLVVHGGYLFASGRFTASSTGEPMRIAMWDGSSWLPFAAGGPQGEIRALAFSDEDGLTLYAGGRFALNGASGQCVARFDGDSWSLLDSGPAGGSSPTVHALAVHDDGSGPALYAGGQFTHAGGLPASHVARWDGEAWSPLGSGQDDVVYALVSFDSALGPRLVAGGRFSKVVRQWDGATWSGMGTGLGVATGFPTFPGPPLVRTLLAIDSWQGGGPTLVAGGHIPSRVAVLVDGHWQRLGDELKKTVVALALVDLLDGTGKKIVACETDPVGLPAWVVRFDEAPVPFSGNWSTLGSGLGGDVNAMAVFDDSSGHGPRLHAAGDFEMPGNAHHLAIWTGAGWESATGGPEADALAVYDDGTGARLYSGGNGFAMWDGEEWDWKPHPDGTIDCFEVFDDGSGAGPLLYAGVHPGRVARWNGTFWQQIGSPFGGDAAPLDLVVFDDGTGARLYATGGSHTSPQEGVADYIASYDGTGWTEVGGGLGGMGQSLAVHDDGSGSALYVAGHFQMAGDVEAQGIARWDGTSWSALGSGLGGQGIGGIDVLTVFDDGTGAMLYAGGTFTIAGGMAVTNLARWDGRDWWPLAAGMQGDVNALLGFDDGTGPALYVGGDEGSVAPDAKDGPIARWAGCAGGPVWIDLGGGAPGIAGVPVLEANGQLTPGSPLSLALTGGAPSALAVLFVASASLPQPFLGGTLHAFPSSLVVALATGDAGELHVEGTFPGMAGGQSLWLQAAIDDPSVPVFGASLSNAMMGTAP